MSASWQTHGWQVTNLSLTIISTSISPSGFSNPTCLPFASDWSEAKMGERPEFSYYQIGGFRPNLFLKGCFSTFFTKIEAAIQILVMSDP